MYLNLARYMGMDKESLGLTVTLDVFKYMMNPLIRWLKEGLTVTLDVFKCISSMII